MDRKKQKQRQYESLPTPKNFLGQNIKIITKDEKCSIGTINELVDDLVKRRITTIELLRVVAVSLDSTEYRSAITTIGGSATSIVGGLLGIVGFSLLMTGVGATVGIPLGVLGAGITIGAAGGVVTEGKKAAHIKIKKHALEKVRQHLDMDYFRNEQCRIISIRKSKDCDFGKKWDFDDFDLGDFESLEENSNMRRGSQSRDDDITPIGKAAITGDNWIIAGVTHWNPLVIPFDIWRIVEAKRRLQTKEPSEQIRKLFDILNALKSQLMKFWIDSGSLHLLPLKDDRWCCIAVANSKKKDFEKRCTSEMTLNEVKKFGHVLDVGADFSKLPKHKLSQFIKMWNHFEGRLMKYLIDNNCLRLVPLKDDNWCCIALHTSKKKEFKKIHTSDMALNDVKIFGHVLENGEDFINLPKDKLSQIIDRWNRMEKLHIAYLERYSKLYSKQV